MFPSVFETSVYTLQATICPSDIMVNRDPLGCQYPPTFQPSLDTSSRSFAEELGLFYNLPVQDCNVTCNTRPHPRMGASNVKTNHLWCPRKRKQTQHEGPVQDTQVRQQVAAKRRRKTKALFFCTVPNCSADFTTKHRLESHIKGYHLGIKDNVCGGCPYATAHPSDLLRHSKLKHT